MLYQWIRTFLSDNGVLTDYSLANQDESLTLPAYLITGQDYYYIAQHYPFNNFFIQVDTANDVSSVMTVEYWNAKEWWPAVDLLDGTSLAGKSLARSGVVQFSPSDSYRWHNISDTSKNYAPTELQSLTLYNLHWLRIKLNATLKTTTAIKRIAYAFTTHQQIDNLDTTVNDYLTSFKTGKTSWDDEIVTSSIQLVNDLRRRGLIVSPGEVLRFDDVTMACDWRTLMLIYRNLGGDYKTKYDTAKVEYEETLNLRRFSFDQNNDAYLSSGELHNKTILMVR